MSDIYYHTKYIKYKSKYFKLKNDMYGGATPWPGTRTPVEGVKCKAEAAPTGTDLSAAAAIASGALEGCPDPSDNYFCAKFGSDLSCVEKCFSNKDCGDASDCSQNMCVPKNTQLVDPPIIKDLTPTAKLASMKDSFKKKEMEAESAEFEQERKRAEKEKNKELLIAYNESLETTTRRRGIKTKQRQEMEDGINKSIANLKRRQDKEKKDMNKRYRQAINAKDDKLKNYLIKVIEDLGDTHRDERERLGIQSEKRRNFLKEKQASEKERNLKLEKEQADFADNYSKMLKTQAGEIKVDQNAMKQQDKDYMEARGRTPPDEAEMDRAQKDKDKIKDDIKTLRKKHEDTLFAMRSQKEEVVNAIKEKQKDDVSREEDMEIEFNKVLDAEVKLYDDMKKQYDTSGFGAVIAAFSRPQVGGYPYYNMYGGGTCNPPDCANSLWKPVTGSTAACLDKDGNPILPASNEGTDASCNWPPQQKRMAEVACARKHVSTLTCKQAKDLKDEKKKWRDTIDNKEKEQATAEKSAAVKMETLLKEARDDFDKLVKKAKERAEKGAAAAAPDCTKDDECDKGKDGSLPDNLTGKCVSKKCAVKEAAPNPGATGNESDTKPGETKYWSIDFDINDYLTETEF